MSDPVGHLGTEESFADMEQRVAEPVKPDLAAIKLEGDDVPEVFRGKTVKETIAALNTTLESFKGSEKARRELQERVDALSRPQVVREETKPAPQPEITKAQIDELYKTDPTAATALIVQKAMEAMNQNLEARLGPIKSSSAATVESQVRNEFKDEFEDFGPQIEQIVQNIPDKSVLGNPESWKQIISYVRGQPENFEKLVARHAKKNSASPAGALTLDAVREAAGGAAPPNITARQVVGGKGGEAPVNKKWSSEEDKVRMALGMTEAQWEKYR